MTKYRVIPLSEMWAWWPAWVVFKDLDGNWCDVTGHIVHEIEDELVIGNREDHRKFEIPKAYIEHLEEITDESRSRWLSSKVIPNVAVRR